MHLIVLDSEVAYLKELLKQISVAWPDLCLLGVWRIEQLIRQLPQLADKRVLFIYNQLEQPGLPAWLKDQTQVPAPENWDFLPIYPDGQPITDRAADCLYRLDSTQRLFTRINNWLLQAEAKIQNSSVISPEKSDYPDPVSMSETCRTPAICQSAPQIWFALRLKPTNSDQLVNRMLQSALNRGLKTIYLPLMPTYLMHLMNPPDQGPTLSDLLLLLMGNAIDDSDAGHYLQPTRHGWLQFRAPARSDDLVSCDPSVLRQLLQFIHRSIRKNPAFVLVDCQGIALASALAATVTADVCQILLPESVGYAHQAAKRELNRFLNQLPGSCQVVMEDPDKNLLTPDDLTGNMEV